MSLDDEVTARAARVRILLMDCDGVLTDGRILMSASGDELKNFHVRDGLGIMRLYEQGIETAIISGRSSSTVEHRATELHVTHLFQSVSNKIEVLDHLLRIGDRSESECAYIGDDLPDIPIMKRVGLAITVPDAAAEVLAVAHFVTRAPGGNGAVREVCELILKAQKKW
jgi:3-deoxy-D-manno-octulosonate 8-phosphate phosphatase (KDO 8-P phosphatase)